MKIRLALLLLLAAHLAGAQTKPVSFGRFQIGITTVDSLNAIMGAPVKASANRSDGEFVNEYTPAQMIELQKPADDGSMLSKMMLSRFVDGYRIFLLSYYKINELVLKNVELVFYGNTLVGFVSEEDEKLKEILIHKYNQPKVVNKTDTVHCVYNLTGNTVAHVNQEITDTWTSGATYAVLNFSTKYNDECEPHYDSWFTMKDKTRYDFYHTTTIKNIMDVRDHKLKNYDGY